MGDEVVGTRRVLLARNEEASLRGLEKRAVARKAEEKVEGHLDAPERVDHGKGYVRVRVRGRLLEEQGRDGLELGEKLKERVEASRFFEGDQEERLQRGALWIHAQSYQYKAKHRKKERKEKPAPSNNRFVVELTINVE